METNQIQTIGYNSKADAFDGFLRSIGVNREYVTMIVQYNWHEFRYHLKEMIANLEAEGRDIPENYLEDLELSEEEYQDSKNTILESIQTFQRSMQETETASKKEWVFPYKEIFNGNFPKLEKSQLTSQLRQIYHVQGLPDEAFDIYYDVEFRKAIPIYYDYSTTNEQFVAFSFYLERMASMDHIPLNPKIPLLLFNRDLMGIDLDHPNLPIEIQAAAAAECEQNPIFTMREAARIRDDKTGEVSKYQLTIGTWTFLWLYCQRFNIYREQPRQTGKTFDICNLLGCEYAAGMRDSKMIIVHFVQGEAAKNRKSMLDSAGAMPKFLRFHMIKSKKVKGKTVWQEEDEDNTRTQSKEVVNIWRNNALKIFAVGTSESSARRTGRGETPRIVHVDEINFINYPIQMMAGIMFAHGTARLLAERANQRYGIFFTSTPGTLDTEKGRNMYDLVFRQMCQWDTLLFGYNYQDLKTFMEKNSDKFFFNISYGYAELGFSEAWMDEKIKAAPNREEFMVDMLMKWLEIAKDGLFSNKHMGRISRMVKSTPHRTFLYEKYHKFTYLCGDDITFEEFIQRYHAISIGIDIAYGTGGDSTVMYAVDMETAYPLFVYHSNVINTTDFTYLAIHFFRYLKRIHPDLLLCINPEVDGPGQSVIPDLVKEKDIEPMIFRMTEVLDPNLADPAIKSTNVKIRDGVKTTYGTRQRKWRQELTGILLQDLVDKYPYAFSFHLAYAELGTLKKNKTGKIEAKIGFHDDVWMACLLAYAPIFFAPFRNFIEKAPFHFIVDFNKIKVIPLTSVIIQNPQQEKRDIEGKIYWRIVERWDEKGHPYDEVLASRVVNGIKVPMQWKEIEQEIMHGDLKEIDELKRIRLPQISSYKTATNVIGYQERNMGTMGYVQTSSQSSGGRAKSVAPYRRRY